MTRTTSFLVILVPIADAWVCSADFRIKGNGPVKSSCKMNCPMQPPFNPAV